MAYVPSKGRLYSFGLNGSGQLGEETTRNATTPQVVTGPWSSNATAQEVNGSGQVLGEVMKKLLNLLACVWFLKVAGFLPTLLQEAFFKSGFVAANISK